MDIADHKILTITQVTNQVKFTLEQQYSNLWIQGEISSCKSYPSGHIYLTLKDGKSELSSVIFSQYVYQLSHQPFRLLLHYMPETQACILPLLLSLYH